MNQGGIPFGSLRTTLLTLFLSSVELGAQSLSFNGQAVGMTALNPASPLQTVTGLRYIPRLTLSMETGRYTLDGEFSANLWGSFSFQADDSIAWDRGLSPYRMWIRFSGERFEVRAGLQKINFGPAQLFRPLMWFDRIDPRDPLQLTEGVYGLLGRYYFLNNASLWLWGLYGDDKTKGWEVFPSVKNTVEFGGRFQFPLYTGEAGVTYHHRTADPRLINPDTVFQTSPAPENRIALDLRMDLVVGIWAEAALIHQELDFTEQQFTSMLNAGLDYTIGLGNGLGIMAEGFGYLSGSKPLGSEEQVVFGLLSVTYPFSLIHNLNAMVFYDFTSHGFYRFINYSMTFDSWTFYLMGFWNPETYNLYNLDLQASLYSGYGFQLMAVFNH